MLSKTPIIIDKVRPGDRDKEILRLAIIAELDAMNLYEQLANMTTNADLKAVLLDVTKEEKTHAGEFQTMLLRLDPEQAEELLNGKKEVEDLVGEG